jgi:hypothetical protein
VPSPGRNFLARMLAEFTRANAAAQRYEDLRYRSARHEGMAPDNIPQQIFEEFYAVEETVELRQPVRRRSASPEGQPRPVTALSSPVAPPAVAP